MEEYDLRDEYELHNLLKKLYRKKNSDYVSFSRMPIMVFGNANRDKQVLDLLIQYAPIGVNDLCKAYEEEYGVLARTVAATFISCIDEYRDQSGMYDISSEALPPEQMKRMRDIMRDDYYDISCIKQLYLGEFPDADPGIINSYTIKSMGFKVYSSYVIKDTYLNATSYFRYILTADDVIDSRNFPSSLRSQVSYTSELAILKNRYEIIEFEPLQYINRRRLESVGIVVQDINDYCEKVSQFVQPYDYFTIHSLRRQGFTHPMDALKFDDWFYASILTEDRERYCYQRMGGTKVFCQISDQVMMENYFKYIVEKYGSMEISEFSCTLKEDFGVNIDKYKIIDVVNNSPMYYDRIMERIHRCSTAYDNVLSEDEKNKALYIIATKFKNGIRVSSNIDFERFKIFYAIEYGDDFIFSSDNLYTFLTDKALVFNNRLYVFDERVVTTVRAYLEQMGFPCILINAFYDKHSADFYAFGVFSIDMLKEFINKYYRDIYYKRDYVYLHSNITPTDLVRGAFDEQEAWSLNELHERLAYLKEDTIRQILNRNEYLRIDTDVFMRKSEKGIH